MKRLARIFVSDFFGLYAIMLLAFSFTLEGNDTNVPLGFESLNEPQTSLIDLYFDGRFIDSVFATYTEETIQFGQPPSQFLSRIPNLMDRP